MGHVEFLGPPGAGKSTIHQYMTRTSSIYTMNTSQLLSDNKVLDMYPITIPVGKLSRDYWRYSLREKYFLQHLSSNPSSTNLIRYVTTTTSRGTESITRYLTDTIAQYEYATEKVPDGEVVCLDEGFSQRCLGVLCRKPDQEFSIGTFLDLIPRPETVIYIKSDPETCLNRQRRRGRIRNNSENSIQENRQMKEWCDKIATVLSCKSVDVITVENSESLDVVVSDVEDKLITHL